MRDCRLVAYRNAGFNPVALASRNPATAREAAQRHHIPTVHDTTDALLADSSVEMLDAAVPPDAQPDLIRRAVELGKGRLRGLLAQKPLALSLADARDLVKRCADANIVLAVNQNMRFDQSVNFLDDRSQTPHLKPTAIDKAFGAGESTGQGKSVLIRKTLKIRSMDPAWALRGRMDRDPMAWMIRIDGFIIDARYLKREVQEEALRKGLIPYIPERPQPAAVAITTGTRCFGVLRGVAGCFELTG